MRSVVSVAILLALSVTCGMLAPRFIPTIAAAENWSADLRVTMLSPALPQHPDIIVAAITEDTLATLPYRSPVDRVFLERLIRWLDDAGVKAIGIDILFDQPTEPEKDALLHQTLQQARAPVVIAAADTADQLTDSQAAFLQAFLDGLQPGLVNLMTDAYLGTVRWIYPGRQIDGQTVPGFASAVARTLGVPPLTEPIDLVYRPPPDADTAAFRTFPAHSIPLLPAEWFAGKVVLIGTDLPLEDRHRTPWSAALGAQEGAQPGVVIHAHAIAQLLDGRASPAIRPLVEFLLVSGTAILALFLATTKLSILAEASLGVVALPLIWAIGFIVYRLSGLLVPLSAPSIAFAISWVLGSVYWRSTAWKQREFIRQAFSRFTAPAVVDQLIADPTLLRLRGEKREITSLFTDLAGFTAWIERTDPEMALTTLNEYLDGMCQIAVDRGGTIDKIVGDALHVIFSAPLPQPDHAERAVACALEMGRFGSAFAARQRALGNAFGVTRIGVHSGMAVVGNFGGDRFFDYTAYGDTINTAARLEGANKYLGTLIAVSGETARRCTRYTLRPVGTLLLAGKAEPTDVYEPLDPDSGNCDTHAKYLEAFERMRDHDPKAGELIAGLARAHPDDGLITMHAARLARGETGALLKLKEK